MTGQYVIYEMIQREVKQQMHTVLDTVEAQVVAVIASARPQWIAVKGHFSPYWNIFITLDSSVQSTLVIECITLYHYTIILL